MGCWRSYDSLTSQFRKRNLRLLQTFFLFLGGGYWHVGYILNICDICGCRCVELQVTWQHPVVIYVCLFSLPSGQVLSLSCSAPQMLWSL